MNPLSCSQCGAVNASDARVCYQCKKILSIGAHSICGSCYHRNPLHLANCVNCGMELVEAKELEKESAMAFEQTIEEGTGPLTPPNTGELPSEVSADNEEPDPSFYEAKTKKHEIPEFEIDPPEMIENSTSGIEPAVTQTDIMDNEKDISDLPEHEQEQPAVESSIPSNADVPDASNEDVDILSMLDLDLTEEKFPSEPPRQISEDQIQPTDWINELVPSTDELPTMADMLPEPTAPNTEDDMAMPSSVMDLLFGDTTSLDPSEADGAAPEPPTVPNMEIRAQENIEIPADEVLDVPTAETAEVAPAEPAQAPSIETAPEAETADGWLSDAMTDIDDSADDLFDDGEMSQEELPDWMDFDINSEAEASADAVEQSGLVEELSSAVEAADIADDDDALDWLTDDAVTENVNQVELPEPLNASTPEASEMSHNGTRDLSESPFSEKANELNEAVDSLETPIEEVSAVQANLPNWIKEMAPGSETESVGIAAEPESDSGQMDDDALSAILDSMGSDSEETVVAETIEAIEPSEPVVSVEPIEEAIVIPEPPIAEEIPDFEPIDEISPADITEPEFDFSKTPEPSEEQLLQEAISAIESEIEEIKGTTSAPEELVPEAKLPEPTSTKDLPDWLQSPQTSPLNPEDLGFIEAKIEEARAISAEEIPDNPAEEISNIIAENVIEEPEIPEVTNEITQAPADASDQLSQFDWSDVESVFDTPAEPVSEPETPLTPSFPEIEEPTEDEPDLAESAVESAAFDWLQDSNGMNFDEPQEINTSDFADLNLEPLENISIGTPHDIDESIPAIDAEIDADVPSLEAELDSIPEMPKMEDILGTEPELPSADAGLELSEAMPDFSAESGLDELNVDPLADTPLPDIAETFEPVSDISEDINEQTNEFESFGNLNGSDGIASEFSNGENFEPLKEFHDESDVFATVRDQPPVENSFSPESLSPFETGPIDLPNNEVANNFSLDSESQSADDFFNALAEENSSADMPAWADELTESSTSAESMPEQNDSGVNPLAGIDDVVGIAPSISNQVSEIQNLHTPQMMEPIAHRKRARMAAQAAGTVPMTDPTQPVVVPKERQKYQPRFNANQFDGRPSLDKKKRHRQVGFLVVAGVLTLAVLIAVSIPFVLRLFS